jgi:exodeoxyribonuclease VII large subunit
VQALSRRVDLLRARPALAAYPARLALRGRRTAEQSHALAHAARAIVAARARRVQVLRRQLDTYDLGRRLAAVRTRLVSGRGRLDQAIARSQHRADARLRDHARRLETLSPLAVLGRGYAVCWNADRTQVIRDAGATAPGDLVQVTLGRGELECTVRSTADSPERNQR